MYLNTVLNKDVLEDIEKSNCFSLSIELIEQKTDQTNFPEVVTGKCCRAEKIVLINCISIFFCYYQSVDSARLIVQMFFSDFMSRGRSR